MKYRYFDFGKIELQDYSIIPVQPETINSIRVWRNKQMDYLRQKKPVSFEEQEKYYSENIWPDMRSPRPKSILVNYFLNKKHIGYGGLVHISWENKRAEVSFLIEPTRSQILDLYCTDMVVFLEMIKTLAFRFAKLSRIFTETYSLRPHQIENLELAGFTKEGILKEHLRVKGKPYDSVFHGFLKKNYKK
jgi:hypothetical protein